MEPITFRPIYMERVWGGREMAKLYQRDLPGNATPIGESWELVDRKNEQSVVDHGPWAGTSLNELWCKHREEIFGNHPPSRRFPILLKILDARSDLSIQVHPPAAIAQQLGGEPKTEMWFIADCDPGATLYVGLKHGVKREDFEGAIRTGNVAGCVHQLRPNTGDSIFIPSGRLHAIGGGFLIHEIQQNSDTTYRVFDWNRTGLDGNPRELHVDASLASIDFEDIEPAMNSRDQSLLADCPHFRTARVMLGAGAELTNPDKNNFSLISIINGSLQSIDGREFEKGRTLLLPRGASPLTATRDCLLLQVTLPDQP